uniref:Uncharacterized protein n=1 Tax=Globodera pallida TaxID=36090 RepID=A0A183BU17_GLOPA
MRWPSSLRVDQEILLSTGHSVQRLKMYPYFDAAHYILMILSVREDLGSNFAAFSRRHPFSCWLSSMVVCFAGSFLANFLLGEPLVAVFRRQEDILLATLVCLMKECQRVYKINHGVLYAARLSRHTCLSHPYNRRHCERRRLIRGVWMPSQVEVLRPSFTTKACVIAAVLFTVDKSSGYMNLPHEIIYLGIVLFFVYFRN